MTGAVILAHLTHPQSLAPNTRSSDIRTYRTLYFSFDDWEFGSHHAVANREGGKGRTPVPKFLHFHAVFGKSGSIVGWRPLPLRVGAFLLGNPGSATAMRKNEFKDIRSAMKC